MLNPTIFLSICNHHLIYNKATDDKTSYMAIPVMSIQ